HSARQRPIYFLHACAAAQGRRTPVRTLPGRRATHEEELGWPAHPRQSRTRCSVSMSLMVAAMKMRVGNPLRKLVLIKLADNASDQGECWPSYQHIADQCEISKRSVMNHINVLCDSGFLRKEIRKGGPKGN